MASNEGFEVRKYTSPYSLLVIGPAGIRRIYTPFTVTCRNDIHIGFTKGQELKVTRVLLGGQKRLMFEINNKIFIHSLFQIP